MPDTPPIIITGGSVTVEFNEGSDENASQLRRGAGGSGKYTASFHNAGKKIDRVEITGDFTYSNGVATTKNGQIVVSVYLK